MKRYTLIRAAGLVALAMIFSATVTAAQQNPLSLTDALAMARKNNGTVRSAFLNFEAAKANKAVSGSAFLPTVTPSYNRTDSRTNGGNFAGNNSSNSALVTFDWTLLDNGRRQNNFRQSSLSAEIAQFSALQTLRNTLFEVHSRYYDALRAQESLRVNQSQVERATAILEQTKERVRRRDAAAKDILQAEADLLNAKAALVTSEIQVETSLSSLKAILGFPEGEELVLEQKRPDAPQPLTVTLAEAIEMGLKSRPDLESDRRRVESQKALVRSAKMDSMAEWTLGANVRKSFGDSVFDTSQLVFNVSIPLFDGARSKNVLRGAELNLQSQNASLDQSVRDAKAEIESSYRQYTQNLRRLEATKLALDAANLNFRAASEARTAGAGDLIQVLTAQLTLVTAESSYVAAYYDTLVSEVRFRLATGQAMPGE